MSWWAGLPKVFVEATTAKASEVNENFQAVKEALLYLLSEEEHSPFVQLTEPAKRVVTLAENLTLLSATGTSRFLKLPADADHTIDRGVNTVTSGGPDGYSDISHNLGEQPKVVIATHDGAGFQVNVTTGNYSSGQFRCYAYRTDGANLGTVSVAWVAIS